eukprot:scaffold1915_cov143-Skeletonema_menzelii.AAC.4
MVCVRGGWEGCEGRSLAAYLQYLGSKIDRTMIHGDGLTSSGFFLKVRISKYDDSVSFNVSFHYSRESVNRRERPLGRSDTFSPKSQRETFNTFLHAPALPREREAARDYTYLSKTDQRDRCHATVFFIAERIARQEATLPIKIDPRRGVNTNLSQL